MGRFRAPVTQKDLAKLSKVEGNHALGGVPGLYLAVSGGGRSYTFRYRFACTPRELGLGSYQDLTLQDARDKAGEQRKLVKAGIDPIAVKRGEQDAVAVATAAKSKSRKATFRKCVEQYLAAHGDEWTNAKHRAQWSATLETYAGPFIGDMEVALIDTPEVLQVLNPIWTSITETATRVRQRMESVLDYAKVAKYRTGDNPARWRGHLDEMLGKPSKIAPVEHHAALPFEQIGAFMEKLRKQKGFGAAAVELAVLTAARSGEVRGAVWPEIDFDGRRWSIPARRMKAKRDHDIPLSGAAIAVLKRMKKDQLGDHVFPGAREGRPLSDMSLLAVLERMGLGEYTVHGFRSAFRDWAAEKTSYPNHVCEMALAHTVQGVEGDYRRGNLFDKRTALMKDWASYCNTVQQDAKVIPIRAA